MEKRMKSSKPARAINRRAAQPRTNWQYYAIAAVCCALLVAGFFFAARQHFSSMEYGLQNSRLRKQLDELQSEKRRLLLTREVSLTPGELRKAARRIGFLDTPAIINEPTRADDAGVPKAAVKLVKASTTAGARPANNVVPTVINLPVNKTGRFRKPARRDVAIYKEK